MSGWTALLLAGSRPGGDPFATAQGAPAKALIRVAGVPMVARVTATLLACPQIGRVVVLAQAPDMLRPVLPPSARIELRASGATIAQTVREFATGEPAPWPLFVTTADHALLTPETVAAFLAAVRGPDDVAVGVVSRAVVRARFPDNKRTWLRFGDGQYTGANLFALTGPAALAALGFWAEVEQDRKKGWRLVAKLGPGLLLRALLGRLTLQGALDAAGARLGARIKAVALADPLAAVDVDKESDLALATAVLEGRA